MSHENRSKFNKSKGGDERFGIGTTFKQENWIEQNDREDQYYVDEQLRPMQRIEGGGGPKKVYLQNMPKPVRYFGYFFVFGVPILLITLIIISYLK
ncbi:hypothetical protein G5B47_00325 [Paenibacillus sp. 7124]|uniref:Uncharacterized protein n=1 Tax=Paenibacillus apii TaxID=1850370 RepID=A0A6M1PEV6_9BACL|nr:hypothetical protein [Paenibacillus apii]NGM80848.1 hypothetical protein [Paenibacillus apii]